MNEKREKIRHSWYDMKQRCLDPKNPDYKHYGGRGITVCSRWLDFQNFYDDMADGWFPGSSIDRINNDGNYEPENCRWISRAENSKKSCDEHLANGTHPFQDPEYRKNQSERMKQKTLEGTNPFQRKGMTCVWDLVEQKHVRFPTDLFYSNRERYLTLSSRAYKGIQKGKTN